MVVCRVYLAVFILLFFGDISSYGQIITTVAGGGTGSSLGDGGQATAAKLGLTAGLAIASNGNIYIADGNNYRIRKVDILTGIITTVAGTGTAGYNGDGIPATTAQLKVPAWISLDTVDNLYIGDEFRIRKVDAITHIISTVLGTGTSGFSSDGVVATAAMFSGGLISCDTFGNLYFGDPQYFRIRNINASGTLNTVAGTGMPGSSGDGGAATAAKIQAGGGIYADIKGNVWVVDGNASVRKIIKSTGVIIRVAGTGDTISSPYSGDGTPATACHIGPFSVAVDYIGNLYIADYTNNLIEKVDTFGIIHSIAGTGTSGFSGDGGSATTAKISHPENVALDLCGNIYIADFNNKRIRKITYPANPFINISGATTASLGSSVILTATINGAGGNYTIKWYNKGVLFNTTTTPSVTYTKTMCTDSITAVVYGCSDSATSNLRVVGCNVGVASPVPSHRGVTCYPNPVNGELIIAADGEKIEDIVITNLLGEVVFKQAGNSEETVKVDMRCLPKGLYFVKVACPDASGGRVYVERVVKE